MDPRVRGEPLLHGWVHVGGVVVHHQVQIDARVGAGDLTAEHEELLVAVPRGSHHEARRKS